MGDATNKVSMLSIFAIQKMAWKLFKVKISMLLNDNLKLFKKNRFRSLLVYKFIKNGTTHLLNVTFGSGY